MLTPQEVSDRSFPKASFGGYNMASVDEFLDLLTADYSSLYSENAVLKSKMKVLVDKLEDYRSTEEAMRRALMSAQRMADDMVKDAETRSKSILKSAEEEAAAQIAAIQFQREAEQFRLQSAQLETADFVNKVRALHAKELEYLEHLNDLCPDAPSPQVVTPEEETASEIDDNVQRILTQALVEATAENLQADVADEPAPDLSNTAEFSPFTPADLQDDEDDAPPAHSNTTRVDFGKLQFGADYEIK